MLTENGFAMSTRLLAASLALAAVLGPIGLVSPALGQQGWDQTPSAAPAASKSLPTDPYSRAMLLKQKGQYSEAIPLLQELAKQGHGYEVVQLELGKCYFDLAAHATTPAEAAQLKTKGFAWVLKAAGNGSGTAEEELVRLYLDGNGVPVDRVEAAKWYFLWRRNPSRMQIGNAQFDAGLEARLKASLHSAQWQDAQKRADEWQPL
jgi:TPR repeat protein